MPGLRRAALAAFTGLLGSGIAEARNSPIAKALIPAGIASSGNMQPIRVQAAGLPWRCH